MNPAGELVGISACVAGIVNAYHDGERIIQKIKQRRAQQRLPPPPRLLDESISQAPEEIDRERQRGIQRFGAQFEQGDHIAVIALQQITIQLQGTLLAKLQTAAFDDEVENLDYLVDAADLGRDRTIGVLLELRQRLLKAPAVHELPTSSPNAERDGAACRPYIQKQYSSFESSPERNLGPCATLSTKHLRNRSQTHSSSHSHDASGEEDAKSGASAAEDSSSGHTRRNRHSSLLGMFKHRHRSGADDLKPDDTNIRKQSAAPSYLPWRSSQGSDARVDAPKFTYEEGDRSAFERSPARRSQQDEPVPVPPEDTAGSRQASVPNYSASRTSLMLTTSNTPSTAQNSVSGGSGSIAIPQPTPENEYLGFCKGAWRLQNGERKAMKERKEFNDGWSHSSVPFLACTDSKCAFSGHIDVDVIWTKVWKMKERIGIKFRWQFLAKSHVTQQKVKDHQYMYQCLFCVFLGLQAPVLHGTDLYLDHISQEHRGKDLGEVILYKTGCVADRICDDNEIFDINLLPLTDAELRKPSAVLSDDLLVGLNKDTDAQDSMFSNEPWNEGLSDFHIGGELERSELE